MESISFHGLRMCRVFPAEVENDRMVFPERVENRMDFSS